MASKTDFLKEGLQCGFHGSSPAASGLSFAFGLPQGFWAVITALIVTQSNVGGSLKAVARRFGIAFLLEQLRRDLDDLRDRAVKFSRPGETQEQHLLLP